MARLGSKKNPLFLTIQSEKRAEEIMHICNKNDWHCILRVDPDEKEDIHDLELKQLDMDLQLEYTQPKLGRNDLCHCGSGKKYKKCCILEDQQYQSHALTHTRNALPLDDSIEEALSNLKLP